MLCGAGPGVHVLDIACGTGVMEPELLKLGAARITAIDIAENMVKKARENYNGEEKIRFVACDLLEFEGGPFDCALLYNAYPHFPEKAAVLQKVASLLKPGGRFTVAHGAGRKTINAHHDGSARCVSVGLKSAKEEAAVWNQFFFVDTLVDTEDIYIISGTVKLL